MQIVSSRSVLLSGVAAALAVLGLSEAKAQAALEIPSPSPRARVEQQVGITTFSVDYASPAVKGRRIFGGIVPFDRVWRTGANEATVFTASREFTFGDQQVPAGSYAIFTIPGKSSWTVILNRNTKAWGVRGYDAANDVARVTVRPENLSSSRERLTFLFSDATEATAHLDIEWEKVRVRVPFGVDTPSHTLASIEGALKDAWRPHFASARWLLQSNGNLEQALGFADKSIAIEANWWNHWLKAQILDGLSRREEALTTARTARTLGKGEPIYEGFYKEAVEHAIGEWSK